MASSRRATGRSPPRVAGARDERDRLVADRGEGEQGGVALLGEAREREVEPARQQVVGDPVGGADLDLGGDARQPLALEPGGRAAPGRARGR